MNHPPETHGTSGSDLPRLELRGASGFLKQRVWLANGAYALCFLILSRANSKNLPTLDVSRCLSFGVASRA